MTSGWERPMIRIPLRVSGVDLDDDATLDLLGQHLSDLAWSESDGIVLATLHTPGKNPVAKAIEAARRICHSLPAAEVVEVDQELVSTSDIAFRLGVSREAVRLWVEGLRGPGGFPSPAGTVSNGKSRVWPWSVVHSWVKQNYQLGGDEHHLTRQQVAELNAALLRVKHQYDTEWEIVSSFNKRVRPPEDSLDHPQETLSNAEEAIIASALKEHMNLALALKNASSVWAASYGGQSINAHIDMSSDAPQTEEAR